MSGAVAEKAGAYHLLDSPCWDSLINRENLYHHINGLLDVIEPSDAAAIAAESPLAPVGMQEVWAPAWKSRKTLAVEISIVGSTKPTVLNYSLNQHRLACGDQEKKFAFARTLNGTCPNLKQHSLLIHQAPSKATRLATT